MSNKINKAPLVIVLGIAAILQLALIGVDCQQTPIEVAKAFANAYYYLDADMQDYLCDDLSQEGQTVDAYLLQKKDEAHQRGLSTNYLRHKFTKMHVSVISSEKDTMEVHLTGSTRVCINPAFMLVGRLFRIGRDYPVDASLELVKENNQWRVCGRPFELSPQT